METLCVFCPWRIEVDAMLIMENCRFKCGKLQIVWNDITGGVTDDMLNCW